MTECEIYSFSAKVWVNFTKYCYVLKKRALHSSSFLSFLACTCSVVLGVCLVHRGKAPTT